MMAPLRIGSILVACSVLCPGAGADVAPALRGATQMAEATGASEPPELPWSFVKEMSRMAATPSARSCTRSCGSGQAPVLRVDVVGIEYLEKDEDGDLRHLDENVRYYVKIQETSSGRRAQTEIKERDRNNFTRVSWSGYDDRLHFPGEGFFPKPKLEMSNLHFELWEEQQKLEKSPLRHDSLLGKFQWSIGVGACGEEFDAPVQAADGADNSTYRLRLRIDQHCSETGFFVREGQFNNPDHPIPVELIVLESRNLFEWEGDPEYFVEVSRPESDRPESDEKFTCENEDKKMINGVVKWGWDVGKEMRDVGKKMQLTTDDFKDGGLKFTVWEKERKNKHDFCGEAYMLLSDWVLDDSQRYWDRFDLPLWTRPDTPYAEQRGYKQIGSLRLKIQLRPVIESEKEKWYKGLSESEKDKWHREKFPEVIQCVREQLRKGLAACIELVYSRPMNR